MPALGDSDTIRGAFDRSTARTRRWAEATGRSVAIPEPAECDRQAVVDLCSRVDLLKVQAHGLLVPDDYEVAVMVARPQPPKPAAVTLGPGRRGRECLARSLDRNADPCRLIRRAYDNLVRAGVVDFAGLHKPVDEVGKVNR